jgi:aminoglycoside phosphotransferase (APT) family kinase protein
LRDRDGRVLVVAGEGDPVLPEVRTVGLADDELEAVRTALAGVLGVRVAVLRQLARAVDRGARHLDVVYALESLDPRWEPPSHTTWLEELDGELAALVEDGPVPPERTPWAREGWLAEAEAWIGSSLGALGRAPTGPLEQIRVWALSAVLRVQTDDGAVYFKAPAALPLFVDEGRVMQGLARLHREVPRPLAVDRERRWMLLDDVGAMIGWDAPREVREAALFVFGALQARSASQLDALLGMGCVDRRPAWLAREIRALLADDDALAGLDSDDGVRVRAVEPQLISLCRRLADGPVPDALVHGDLHLDNIARNGDGFFFIDWTDACVTHPFLDLIDVHREEDADTRDRLRDAYLSAWRDVAPQAVLLDLWELARPLSYANQAVSYRHIAANVEPGSGGELEWAIPHWLRLVLETDLELA